jgi:hypothetical protein
MFRLKKVLTIANAWWQSPTVVRGKISSVQAYYMTGRSLTQGIWDVTTVIIGKLNV